MPRRSRIITDEDEYGARRAARSCVNHNGRERCANVCPADQPWSFTWRCDACCTQFVPAPPLATCENGFVAEAMRRITALSRGSRISHAAAKKKAARERKRQQLERQGGDERELQQSAAEEGGVEANAGVARLQREAQWERHRKLFRGVVERDAERFEALRKAEEAVAAAAASRDGRASVAGGGAAARAPSPQRRTRSTRARSEARRNARAAASAARQVRRFEQRCGGQGAIVDNRFVVERERVAAERAARGVSFQMPPPPAGVVAANNESNNDDNRSDNRYVLCAAAGAGLAAASDEITVIADNRGSLF